MAAESLVRIVFLGDSAQAVRSVNTLERSFGGLGKTAKVVAGAIGIGLVGALAGATAAAIDFDRSMRNVNSIAKLSEGQFQALSKEVLALGKTTGQTPKVLADGLYDIVSSGFKAHQAIGILAVSAKAATAGMTDTATASKAVVAILNAYHLEAGKAKNVSSLLFQEVNKGVNTFEELAQNIGDTAPQAAALKVPFEQVAAGLATITLHGTSMAEASTQMSRVLASLIKPTDALKEEFKKLGFENGQAAVQSLGFVGVIKKLSDEADGNQEKLATWLGDIRGIRGVLNLSGANLQQFTQFVGDMSDAYKKGGVDTKAFNEQAKSISVQWAMAKSALIAAAIPIGQMLFPALSKAAGGVQSLAEWITKLKPRLIEIKNQILDFGKKIWEAFSKTFSEAVGSAGGKMNDFGMLVKEVLRDLAAAAQIAAGILGTVLGTAFRTLSFAAAPLAAIIHGLADALGNQWVRAAVVGAAAMVATAFAVGKLVAAFQALKMLIAILPWGLRALATEMAATNPIISGLLALVGLATAAYILWGHEADHLAEKQQHLADSIRHVNDATLALKDSDLAVKEAKQAHAEAVMAEDEALKHYHQVLKDTNATSHDRHRALLALRAANLGVMRSELELEHATKDDAQARQHLAETVGNQRKRLGELNDEFKKSRDRVKLLMQVYTESIGKQRAASEAFRDQGHQLRTTAHSLQDAQKKMQAWADENRKAHPHLAKLAQDQADLAGKRAKVVQALLDWLNNTRKAGDATGTASGKVKDLNAQLDRLDGRKIRTTVEVKFDVFGASLVGDLLQVPQHAAGGFVAGRPGSPKMILAHAGEVILNPEQQEQFGGPGFFRRMFGHGSEGGDSFAAGGIVGKKVPRHQHHHAPPEWKQLSGAARTALHFVSLIRREERATERGYTRLSNEYERMHHGFPGRPLPNPYEVSALISSRSQSLGLLQQEKEGLAAAIYALRSAISGMVAQRKDTKDTALRSRLGAGISDFRTSLSHALRERHALPGEVRDVRSDLREMVGFLRHQVNAPRSGTVLPLEQVGQLQRAFAIQQAQKGLIGSFAKGTLHVPATGLALVHAGESITPAGRPRSGGGDGYRDIVVNLKLGGPLEPLAEFVTATVDTPQVADRISVRIGKQANDRARGGRYG